MKDVTVNQEVGTQEGERVLSLSQACWVCGALGTPSGFVQ